jgi:hypothetical protein
LAPGRVTAAESAEAIVDALQNYDATTDFVADFRQETAVKTLTVPQSRRQALLQASRKMLWSYDTPKDNSSWRTGIISFYQRAEPGDQEPAQNAFRGDIRCRFRLAWEI